MTQGVGSATRGAGAPAGGALVSPDWVAAHLSDPDVVLFEVDEEPADYHLAHLPGATYVDWHDTVRALLGPADTARATFEDLMSRRGVQPEDEVVVYGDAGSHYAAAVFWLLRVHGHRRLRLMDGGRAAWVASGRQLTAAETRRPRTCYRAGTLRSDVRATRDDVLRHLQEPGAVTFLDCRSSDEFAGRRGPVAAVRSPVGSRGHVPGAVNLPSSLLVDEQGRLRPPDELAALVTDLPAGRPLLAYCHRSERSCLTWFALTEVLGHADVRVYDGGWQEYSALTDAVVQR